MSMTRLPELPDAGLIYMGLTGNPEHAYSADQMHAYGLAVWKAAMETAAAECQRHSLKWDGPFSRAAADCSAAIRSLPLPEQGSPQ